MATNRRYYYLKLKDSFFQEDAIVLLRSMPEGKTYIHLLLMMYLMSLKHLGLLKVSDTLPHTAQSIAIYTRETVNRVKKALAIFEELGLVETLPNGYIYMSDIESLIGSTTTEGDRKRKARQKIADLQNEKADKSAPFSMENEDICPPEKKTDTDSETDLSPKTETETKQEAEPEAPDAQTRVPVQHFGKYRNVLLSDDDFRELRKALPSSWKEYVERLSRYLVTSGKEYGNHLTTMLQWAERDAEKLPLPLGTELPDLHTLAGE